MARITRKMEKPKVVIRVNHSYVEYIYGLSNGNHAYLCDTKNLVNEDSFGKNFTFEMNNEKVLIKKMKINKRCEEDDFKDYLIKETEKIIKANNENLVR